MKAFSADLRLTLQARENELRELFIFLFWTKDQNAFNELCQQELVMKRYVRPTVLQRKNDPGSQLLKN